MLEITGALSAVNYLLLRISLKLVNRRLQC